MFFVFVMDAAGWLDTFKCSLFDPSWGGIQSFGTLEQRCKHPDVAELRARLMPPIVSQCHT